MRIDRGFLDRSGLDRSFGIRGIISLEAILDSESDIYGILNIIPDLSAALGSVSDIGASVKITHLLSAGVDTSSDLYALLSPGYLCANIGTESDVYALLRQIASVKFGYTGTIAPGETVCIDGRLFTVKLDGVNAVENFTGKYPTLFPGTNWVVYTDSEGSRTIKIVVYKRDRSI